MFTYVFEYLTVYYFNVTYLYCLAVKLFLYIKSKFFIIAAPDDMTNVTCQFYAHSLNIGLYSYD